MAQRKIAHIDEELCTGCGLCVTPCVEGAIELVNGKARIVREELCDGAGFCLAICPTGALSIQTREIPTSHEQAAKDEREPNPAPVVSPHCFRCGTNDAQAVLLPCRQRGQSLWVCTHCLPSLIHG